MINIGDGIEKNEPSYSISWHVIHEAPMDYDIEITFKNLR